MNPSLTRSQHCQRVAPPAPSPSRSVWAPALAVLHSGRALRGLPAALVPGRPKRRCARPSALTLVSQLMLPGWVPAAPPFSLLCNIPTCEEAGGHCSDLRSVNIPCVSSLGLLQARPVPPSATVAGIAWARVTRSASGSIRGSGNPVGEAQSVFLNEREETLRSGGLRGRAQIPSWKRHHTRGVRRVHACTRVCAFVCKCSYQVLMSKCISAGESQSMFASLGLA